MVIKIIKLIADHHNIAKFLFRSFCPHVHIFIFALMDRAHLQQIKIYRRCLQIILLIILPLKACNSYTHRDIWGVSTWILRVFLHNVRGSLLISVNIFLFCINIRWILIYKDDPMTFMVLLRSLRSSGYQY